MSTETKVPIRELYQELDKRANECQLQADNFFERGMAISEASSLAMKVAYLNVKSWLEETTAILTK